MPINSALFAKAKDLVPDNEQLWIGRRCLDRAVDDLKKLNADINIALLHHPLYWLHPGERPNIKAKLQQSVDFVLRGHLHETEIECVVSPDVQTFHMAAGAAYDTRKWPNRALYCSIDGAYITIFPIRYEDSPEEVWVTDPSVFPYERGHEKRYSIPRLAVSMNRQNVSAEAFTSSPKEKPQTPKSADSPVIQIILDRTSAFVGGTPHVETVAFLLVRSRKQSSSRIRIALQHHGIEASQLRLKVLEDKSLRSKEEEEEYRHLIRYSDFLSAAIPLFERTIDLAVNEDRLHAGTFLKLEEHLTRCIVGLRNTIWGYSPVFWGDSTNPPWSVEMKKCHVSWNVWWKSDETTRRTIMVCDEVAESIREEFRYNSRGEEILPAGVALDVFVLPVDEFYQTAIPAVLTSIAARWPFGSAVPDDALDLKQWVFSSAMPNRAMILPPVGSIEFQGLRNSLR